jgi:hydroxymethylpyrimidine pyrophosphatase-like HAD family hydrolase
VLTVIVIITGRSICGVNIIVKILTITGRCICVLTVIVTITGRHMCSVSSYCSNIDNNKEIYMQC